MSTTHTAPQASRPPGTTLRTALHPRARRGVAAVMAMLYLILISTLAVGFYAATCTAVQIASNEQHAVRAFAAAESGLQLMRYQLARVRIPYATSNSALVNEVLGDLRNQLLPTANLAGKSIDLSGSTILVPTTGTIALDIEGSAFHASITPSSDGLVLAVTGSCGASEITRRLALTYTRQPAAAGIFDYAVAARGRVTVDGSTITGTEDADGNVDSSAAKVMSASTDPIAIDLSKGSIGDANGGSIAVVASDDPSVNPLDRIDAGRATVHGTSDSDEIRAHYASVVAAPEFPEVDTTVFRPYATNTYDGSGGTVRNVYIPPDFASGKKKGVSFNGGDVLEGVIYVDYPNTVSINGNVTINGIIVFARNSSGGADQSVLSFSGNSSITQTQPAAGALAGLALVAPDAVVANTGSFSATFKGNVIVNSISVNGAATMDFEDGSLIAMSAENDSAVFSGSKPITFRRTKPPAMPPMGLRFSDCLKASYASYTEVPQ